MASHVPSTITAPGCVVLMWDEFKNLILEDMFVGVSFQIVAKFGTNTWDNIVFHSCAEII